MTVNAKRQERLLVEAVKRAVQSGGRIHVPEAHRIMWSAFTDLSNARTMGPVGPNPIQFVEIDSWAKLNRWPLEPRHVALIRAMDDAWIEAIYTKGEKAAHAPATPATLDAVFDAAGW